MSGDDIGNVPPLQESPVAPKSGDVVGMCSLCGRKPHYTIKAYAQCLEKQLADAKQTIIDRDKMLDEVIAVTAEACLCVNHGEGGGAACDTCNAKAVVDRVKEQRGT